MRLMNFISTQNGYYYLRGASLKCRNYASKVSFVKHMLESHQLTCDFSVVRRRPSAVNNRKRPPRPKEQQLRRSDVSQGNHPARVWKCKVMRFKNICNYSMEKWRYEQEDIGSKCTFEEFFKETTQVAYDSYRQSREFDHTLKTTLISCQKYWARRKPPAETEYFNATVSMWDLLLSF
jgi:hypothetical protein